MSGSGLYEVSFIGVPLDGQSRTRKFHVYIECEQAENIRSFLALECQAGKIRDYEVVRLGDRLSSLLDLTTSLKEFFGYSVITEDNVLQFPAVEECS